MMISVKNARSIGLTDTQICDLIQGQQAVEAERKRIQRANVAGRPGRPGHTNSPILTSLKKERKKVSKHPFPENWQPGQYADLGSSAEEFERFKDYAKAHNSQYSDWEAAWRNWLRSPYRKSNGNGRPTLSVVRSEDERKERWRLQEERQAKLERGENPYG